MTQEEIRNNRKQIQDEIALLNKYSPLFNPLKDFQLNLCKNVYGELREEPHHSFNMSRQDIDKLILDFANTMIADGDLKNEFFALCENLHPYVKVIDSPIERNGSTGRINAEMALKYPNIFDTTDISKTAVISHLGKPSADGKTLTTNLEKIAIRVHELFHALSEKHCGPNFVSPKSHKVGEIESIFGEALFFEYIKKNAATLATQFNISATDTTIDEKFFTQEAAKHFKNLDIRMATDLDKVFSGTHDFNDPKEHRMRYIVGHLFLPHILDCYDMNADFTMHQFRNFLKNNSHMNMNDATAALTDGAFTSVSNMIDLYKDEKKEQFGEQATAVSSDNEEPIEIQ